MSENIGLMEAVSIAVGGMVGGGIFAVLGVVATGAETAAWIANLHRTNPDVLVTVAVIWRVS